VFNLGTTVDMQCLKVVFQLFCARSGGNTKFGSSVISAGTELNLALSSQCFTASTAVLVQKISLSQLLNKFLTFY